MKVFVTGASGHLGSALLPELLRGGHAVVGLARSEDAAGVVSGRGAEVVRGDLSDTDLLHDQAAAADGVIHLAFRHDLMRAGRMDQAAETDIRALDAMGAALAGTGKPLVWSSGTLLLASLALDRPGTEDDAAAGGYRVDAENAVVALAEKGVRSAVVRLPPTVHSDLDHHGFVPMLIEGARRHGFSGFVGDGSNRWPAVHTLDAARLYRLALEASPPGRRLHAVADEGVEFRTIASVIGERLGVPARSVSPEEAPDVLGMLAFLAALDNPTSSAQTRRLLAWEPVHPGLVDDLALQHYFTAVGG